MKLKEIDFTKLKEYEIPVDNYGWPKETVVYEERENGTLFPSFIRVVNRKLRPGDKFTIEIAENGCIIRKGSKTFTSSQDTYDMIDKVRELSEMLVETEDELTKDEIKALETMTLKFNTHKKAKEEEARNKKSK